MFNEGIQKVISGQHLTRQEARQFMHQMMNGEWTNVQVASLLTALRIKEETAEELIGFAEGMRSYAIKVEHSLVDAVDTCGTGGDGANTFNISTAAAFVAAAAGVPIAKHGNRAASSKCGSVDVLEALGMNVAHDAQMARQMLQETNICFLFAPLYHQAMKHVMPTRKELGFRTCFNLLGPLTNPANVKRQLLGVFDHSLTPIIAEALVGLGVERALVVASLDGLDELTVSGSTRVSEVRNGQIFNYLLSPEEVGLSSHPLEALKGGDAKQNAEIIRRVLEGENGAPRDIVVFNAGAVLYLADRVGSVQEGVSEAQKIIDTGKAKAKLIEAIQSSRRVKHVS
ncbi:anthranilate phosphoribosyltransferase [Seinonella peptonophila]|nr:anthranilate phosphoribosyltransferase [Seinonella peptonophila]